MKTTVHIPWNSSPDQVTTLRLMLDAEVMSNVDFNGADIRIRKDSECGCWVDCPDEIAGSMLLTSVVWRAMGRR